MSTGEITFPLKQRPLLLDIRNGKYTIDEILVISQQYEDKIEDLELNTKLKRKKNYNKINSLLIEMVKNFIS